MRVLGSSKRQCSVNRRLPKEVDAASQDPDAVDLLSGDCFSEDWEASGVLDGRLAQLRMDMKATAITALLYQPDC